MNDFSELENELRVLRPLPPSSALMESVAREIDEFAATGATEVKIIRPDRFRPGWLSLGLGLAAATALVLLVRIDFPRTGRSTSGLASTTPKPLPAVPLLTAQFIPADATRVVYNRQDEGLIFPNGSTAPVRRVRSSGRETLQWHNPGTGASLRVSYPSEEVQLIPVAGQ